MRTQRHQAEDTDGAEFADGDTPFRTDLERIRFSPYYARLSAVTQVIGQTAAGPLVHNRLTHTLKVASVARSIAVELQANLRKLDPPETEFICDPVVAQAAANAHDLGHPPFGHLGEAVLNRLARETLGLVDGFEGNAQSYRILTTLDVCHGPASGGLNLTAASRSAVAKYPWTPAVDISVLEGGPLPPGLRLTDGELSVRKYSAYFLDAVDLAEARGSSHGLIPLQQSMEGSVMDIADDIAYSIHDVDDFHRARLLSQGAISREFREWTEGIAEFRRMDDGLLIGPRARPGSALELLRRKLQHDDPWIADDDAFIEAVHEVADDLVDGLLAGDFDGSIATERALSSFTSRWIHHLQDSVVLAPRGNSRTGLVTLDRRAWHEVAVLKFVHKHFGLNRSDIALNQRGLSRVLVRVVKGLIAWLDDTPDRNRVPPRLQELIEIATEGYLRLQKERPFGIPVIERGQERHLGLGRGVLDYVASLTDGQAIAVSEAIDGRPDRLWDIGQSL